MWTIFWQTLLLAAIGTIIIRIGGRKSISQMTIPQLTIMLSIGTVLGSEVANKGLANTFLASATLIAFLVAMEWVTLKFNRVETALKGKSIAVISNGQMLLENMKTLRFSVDDLEKRLRLAGISKIADVKTGTIENNGELGYELMPHARPVTMGELEKILKANFLQATDTDTESKGNIFSEVLDGQHSQEISKQLH